MQSMLAQQLGKKNGFDNPQQEAYLLMQRALSQLSAPMDVLLKANGLTQSSYNVLRIVKGHGECGVASQAIAPLTVQRLPDVTRLVDRLVLKGMVKRCRCDKDRRVTYVVATEAAVALLEKLDAQIAEAHRQQFEQLDAEAMAQLIALLERSQTFDATPPATGSSPCSAE